MVYVLVRRLLELAVLLGRSETSKGDRDSGAAAATDGAALLLSERRDTAAARRFFIRALRHGPMPVEVTTDKAGLYLRVLDELVPSARHVTGQYANNRIESDHAPLKVRLRLMRGLVRFRSATVIAAGHGALARRSGAETSVASS